MAVATHEGMARIQELLGDEAESLLGHTCRTIDKDLLHLPGPDFVDRVVAINDRRTRCCATCSRCSPRPARRHGLPVHPAGRSGDRAQRGRELRAEPGLLRSREHRGARARGRLQRGRLDARRARRGLAARAHKIPFIVKLNHNELLTYPNKFDQIISPARTRRGRWAPPPSARRSISAAREPAPARRGEPGLRGGARARHVHRALVLPAQLGVQEGRGLHVAADLTGQANHLGVTIEADIIKQKLPEENNGYGAF